MPAPDETRKVQRVTVKIPATISIHPSMEKDFTLAEKEIAITIVDVSANGLGIMSGVYIPEKIILNIVFEKKFACPEIKDDAKMVLNGEAVSSRMTGGMYRIGISLQGMSEEDKNIMKKFLETTTG